MLAAGPCHSTPDRSLSCSSANGLRPRAPPRSRTDASPAPPRRLGRCPLCRRGGAATPANPTLPTLYLRSVASRSPLRMFGSIGAEWSGRYAASLVSGEAARFKLQLSCFILEPDPAQFYDHLCESASWCLLIDIALRLALMAHSFLPRALVLLAFRSPRVGSSKRCLLAQIALRVQPFSMSRRAERPSSALTNATTMQTDRSHIRSYMRASSAASSAAFDGQMWSRHRKNFCRI